MKFATLTGSLVLSLAAASAFAQAPAPAAPPASAPTATAAHDFATLDRNKDGRVSSAEAAVSTELNSEFGKLDANSDTYLSSEEFHKWSKATKPAK